MEDKTSILEAAVSRKREGGFVLVKMLPVWVCLSFFRFLVWRPHSKEKLCIQLIIFYRLCKLKQKAIVNVCVCLCHRQGGCQTVFVTHKGYITQFCSCSVESLLSITEPPNNSGGLEQDSHLRQTHFVFSHLAMSQVVCVFTWHHLNTSQYSCSHTPQKKISISMALPQCRLNLF